ncbi:MAG: class I SAM-dependent methyltransferase, partial [Nitrospirota bacterium]
CLSPYPAKILLKHNIQKKPDWFEHRVNDYKWFKYLSSNLQLSGKTVLDIGAGSGYDSLIVSRTGAHITCLEFNPILSGIGLHNLGQFRWFGGSASNLPFSDEQFDTVIANASLHHLLDIPCSISEAIRVLKPGGYLISMSDSFSNNSSTEEFESTIFNNNTAVMRGINERVPRFDEFIKTFIEHKESLDIRIFTHSCGNDYDYPHEWQIDDALRELPHFNGSISFVVQKKSPITTLQPEFGEEIIFPGEYARHLEDQQTGISRLSDFIPDQFIDLNLLDTKHPKFRLLNGWKIQVTGEGKRAAYLRSRLFFSLKKSRMPYVSVSLLVPYVSNYDTPTISVSVNNENIYMDKLTRGMWHNLTIPLSLKTKAKKAFAFEIHLGTKNTSYEANLFYVRKIDFTDNDKFNSEDNTPELDNFGLESLADTRLIGSKRTCLLCSTDVDHGLNIVNRLKKKNLHVDIIVAKGQESFYSWLPDTKIVGSYNASNFNGTTAGNSVIKHKVHLIATSDTKSIKHLYNLASTQYCNTSTKVYIILPGGHAKEYTKDFFKDSRIAEQLNNQHSVTQGIKNRLKRYPFFYTQFKKVKNLISR